ncbi:MAG: DUF362 domain-containing protein [Verrucomicrobia bacterium]|nr:DUF362 domain-containing protein [Verrucomicrobiota bacterium]
MSPTTSCFTQASSRLKRLVLEQLRHLSESCQPKKIAIKPNWVLHENDPAFPIRALVTDARVIEAAVEGCLEFFPNAESILVGDCPLQYANWPLMCRQAGLLPVIEKLTARSNGKVAFRDLRREVFRQEGDNFLAASNGDHGDPKGYREVELGSRSHLEPISEQSGRFAVNDYSSAVTTSNHRKGSHRYLVCQSILDADLFINLPKWKAHQKSGITCALKNLVGINGDKAYLPHFRRGAPKWGGDEYRDEGRWLYFAQTRLRERFQKRSRFAYKVLKPGWELIKRFRGIETRFDDPSTPAKRFYVAGGAWHGNDTLWRMIYDLNLILQRAGPDGTLHSTPQRTIFCIVDGLVSGEGNGPLQPLPRETDWLAFGIDPFQIDAALAWFMGFDLDRLPIIARRAQFGGAGWGDFDWDELWILLDGHPVKPAESSINFEFVPPPGWREHVER